MHCCTLSACLSAIKTTERQTERRKCTLASAFFIAHQNSIGFSNKLPTMFIRPKRGEFSGLYLLCLHRVKLFSSVIYCVHDFTFIILWFLNGLLEARIIPSVPITCNGRGGSKGV